MQRYKKLFQFVFSISLLSSFSFCTEAFFSDEVLMQNILMQEKMRQKKLFFDKRGHRGGKGKHGHRGHKGSRGPTGYVGSQGEKGDAPLPVETQKSIIYSSHFGISAPYTAGYIAKPVTFSLAKSNNINYDIGGMIFDPMTSQIIVPEEGLYEVHADLSFTSVDAVSYSLSSLCIMTFVVNETTQQQQSNNRVTMTKSVQFVQQGGSSSYTYPVPVMTTFTGSLTGVLSLNAGDYVGVAVLAANRDGSATSIKLNSGGQVNFIVKKVVQGYVDPSVNNQLPSAPLPNFPNGNGNIG